MDNLRDFHGPNAGYIFELYARYQQNPNDVDEKTRALFAQWTPADLAAPVGGNGTVAVSVNVAPASEDDLEKAVALANYAQAIREYGHLAADSNPLYDPPGDPSLEASNHGLTQADLMRLPAKLILGPLAQSSANAYEATEALKRIYCGGIGYDYDHLTDPKEREWLREAAESQSFEPIIDSDGANAITLLERLIKVETFEQFLHKAFVGKKRFSIEGLDMMVPILDEILRMSIEYKVHKVVIGMAHRGRLNVMAHVFKKPYSQILAEFKEQLDDMETNKHGYLGKIGDVKYHKGASRFIGDIEVQIAPNPSHLEHVNPVVEGMARADATDVSRAGVPEFYHKATLPIQVHGDASFSGQGVVAETLNFSDLKGYENGGTIHIIANNQIGFTTNPDDSRSTRYASDLAKGFKIPVVHVNANEPLACLEVARLAIEYRNRFNKDFLIDLIGYRRFGHNEGDEPRFTQPTMYKLVDGIPTVFNIWADMCVERGFLTREAVEKLYNDRMEEIRVIYETLDEMEKADEDPDDSVHLPEAGIAGRTVTKLPVQQLEVLHKGLVNFPEGFNIYSRLKRVVKRRAAAADDPAKETVDWGTAENLAFATILASGTPIRLTGEDVKRGTFSHRHAVFFDEKDGTEFVPLQNLPQAEASFEIHNSPLTENAMIGFEFGYNINKPECLVIWEAQFGDFVNGAQAMLDEYVSSGRAKWNLTPSFVLLLPHGHEGSGPDHSSARLERFLQMTAEKNMRVINCTTAAQYYHLLRRQALLLEKDPLPLIVMSPKSLLRHPSANSSLEELANGRFEEVIDDVTENPDDVRRLILCSGKIYVDLLQNEAWGQNPQIAVARVEQLYPFAKKQLVKLFSRYTQLDEVIWLQEEPRNMGAWRFMQPRISDILPIKRDTKRTPVDFKYIGRPRYASPAEGYSVWHKTAQAQLIKNAFDMSYEDRVLQEKRKN